MKNALIYFFLISTITLFNCGQTEKVDTKQVKDALKRREIKKISEAEIMEAGIKKGKETCQTLITCFNKNSIENLNYKQCLDSTTLSLIDTVKIISLESSNDLRDVEKDLFEAYNYDFTNKQQLFPNLQELNNEMLLYTYPVYYNITDKSFHETPPGDQKPGSVNIVFVYFLKKQLILELLIQ